MHQDTLEVRRRIIKEHLFEGLAVFREVLDIVMPDAEVEYVSACERLALIAFVDVLRTTKNVTDCIARKRLRLDFRVVKVLRHTSRSSAAEPTKFNEFFILNRILSFYEQ